MAIRNILRDSDGRLRKKSRPVERFDERLLELLGDMADTMHKADGVGLAGSPRSESCAGRWSLISARE